MLRKLPRFQAPSLLSEPLPHSASAASLGSTSSWRRVPLAPPCPGPEGGRWKGYLSEGEAQRFAALASATANGLLVIFVLAVALPLLPTKLADPFWLLAFSGAFCTNGFLALLAVLLQLAVVLHAEISSMGHGPDRHSRLALVAALDFALLIPLQLISTWGSLN